LDPLQIGDQGSGEHWKVKPALWGVSVIGYGELAWITTAVTKVYRSHKHMYIFTCF
jgi:hypothetical protein